MTGVKLQHINQQERKHLNSTVGEVGTISCLFTELNKCRTSGRCHMTILHQPHQRNSTGMCSPKYISPGLLIKFIQKHNNKSILCMIVIVRYRRCTDHCVMGQVRATWRGDAGISGDLTCQSTCRSSPHVATPRGYIGHRAVPQTTCRLLVNRSQDNQLTFPQHPLI